MRRLLILLTIVIAAAVVAQFAMRPRIVETDRASATVRTTGIVIVLLPAPWYSTSKLERATVTLSDGGDVEATVLPGCIVKPGDVVLLDVFGIDASERTYVVLGPKTAMVKPNIALNRTGRYAARFSVSIGAARRLA